MLLLFQLLHGQAWKFGGNDRFGSVSLPREINRGNDNSFPLAKNINVPSPWTIFPVSKYCCGCFVLSCALHLITTRVFRVKKDGGGGDVYQQKFTEDEYLLAFTCRTPCRLMLLRFRSQGVFWFSELSVGSLST